MARLPSWLATRLPSWLAIGQAGGYAAKAPGAKSQVQRRELAQGEDRLNDMLRVYPSNQVYSLHRSSLVPGRKLAKRLPLLLSLYPAHIDSLLDIGCAQGFFVFDAALRYPPAHVVGIDASDVYLDLWREVSGWLKLSNVEFHQGLLHDFLQHLEDSGGPFQTVLLVNTYHYLYFGSGLHPFGYKDHGLIFQMLHRLCSERLIWSSPLENHKCPCYSEHGDAGADYTTDRILGAAREFFTVEAAGSLGRRPVYLMYPRPEVGRPRPRGARGHGSEARP